MARFYESRNIDDSQAQYRIVVRTPDGKRTEINLPRQVFEGIEFFSEKNKVFKKKNRTFSLKEQELLKI